MATITITVDDAHVPRIFAAFGDRLNRTNIDPTAQAVPATAGQMRQEILNWVREITLRYERDIAARAAADAVTLISGS